MAVTFDLFGTLVTVDRTASAAAVARELAARGVDVPDDWSEAYRRRHVDVLENRGFSGSSETDVSETPAGAEVPLPAHVAAALRSRGVAPTGNAARRAVVAAFDPEVRTREGAAAAVEAAARRGPVGVLTNCAVPELARRALIRSALDRDAFDAVVTSAGCGWRKPHPRAFAAAADRLGVAAADLVHVGDDPRADGGADAAGATAVLLEDVPLPAFPGWLEGRT